MQKISLRDYKQNKNLRGNMFRAVLWELCSFVFLRNPLCIFSPLKRFILVLFGAKLGKEVVIKQAVHIKYPWRLSVGDYSWIGEEVWIDNIVSVEIGSNVCLSQGAYLCTGNHDWAKQDFPLIVKPIIIEDGAWVGARAIVAPGIRLRSHSILTAGSVLTKDTEPYKVYSGNPAGYVKDRIIQ